MNRMNAALVSRNSHRHAGESRHPEISDGCISTGPRLSPGDDSLRGVIVLLPMVHPAGKHGPGVSCLWWSRIIGHQGRACQSQFVKSRFGKAPCDKIRLTCEPLVRILCRPEKAFPDLHFNAPGIMSYSSPVLMLRGRSSSGRNKPWRKSECCLQRVCLGPASWNRPSSGGCR